MRTIFVTVCLYLVGAVLGSKFQWDLEEMPLPVSDGVFLDERRSVDADDEFRQNAGSVTFYEDEPSLSADSSVKKSALSVPLMGIAALHNDWDVSADDFLSRGLTHMPESQLTLQRAELTLTNIRRLCTIPKWLYAELDGHSTIELETEMGKVVKRVVWIGKRMRNVYGHPKVALQVVWAWTHQCIIPQRVFENLKFSTAVIDETTRQENRELERFACKNVLAAAAMVEAGSIDKRESTANP